VCVSAGEPSCLDWVDDSILAPSRKSRVGRQERKKAELRRVKRVNERGSRRCNLDLRVSEGFGGAIPGMGALLAQVPCECGIRMDGAVEKRLF